ncbi:MAG: NADH-quinone oxidoreductase subunit M [Alphaproteobacteria bacterium]
MTVSWPVLSVITFFPLIGVLLLLLMNDKTPQGVKAIRWTGLLVSILGFLVSLFILKYFDPSITGFQLVEKHAWIEELNIWYMKGVDGISIWFIIISTFLKPFCVLCSWESITTRVKEFMIALMLLQVMMVGMFTATDMLLVYLFFEGVLIPMYVMVGIWGGKNRLYAAYKFFLYTLIGSLLMLLAMLTIYLEVGTTDMSVILQHNFDPKLQIWLWLGFFASFAVKSPIWPVHTWLPDAHTEAPTAGSVMLAGVLLKMGGYGLLRFSIQMLPQATEYFAPLVYTLSIVAIIYTSLVALAQKDLKKLIAYSSVAHMGYVTLGLFTLNQQGMEGAMMQMLSHTVVSAALFLCVGVVYDRLHTRDIARYGGIARNMPAFAVVFMILTLASIGVPGTAGFVGELLAVLGAFKVNNSVAILACTGMVLGAAYMLNLYKNVFLGPKHPEDAAAMTDLNLREKLMFAPMIALVIFMGVYPDPFRLVMQDTIRSVITKHEVSIAENSLLSKPKISVAEEAKETKPKDNKEAGE